MTTMTEVQTTQVYQVFVKATPEAVWDAITKPEFTTKYFFGSAVETTAEPGGPWIGWTADHAQHLVDGEVIESDPPRLLQHTWRALYDAETAAVFAASVAGGWPWVLSGLKTLLETGEPLASGGESS